MSETMTTAPTAMAVGAPTDPGSLLRAGREQRGYSIAKVAEMLRVTPALVSAIEERRFDVFDAPVYVRGLLRSYASLLGLAPEPLIAAFDQLSVGPGAPTLIPPATAERRRRDFGSLRLAAMLVGGALLVAGSYWWWLARSPPSDAARAAPAVAAAPSSGTAATTAPAATPTATPTVTIEASAPVGSPAVAPAGATASHDPVVAPTSAPAAMVVARVETHSVPEDGLVVHGLKECWVEIYAPTGARVLYDNMRPGEARSVPGPGPWRVFLGVASGARLSVGDREVVVPASRRSGDTARFVVATDGAVQ